MGKCFLQRTETMTLTMILCGGIPRFMVAQKLFLCKSKWSIFKRQSFKTWTGNSLVYMERVFLFSENNGNENKTCLIIVL